VQERARAVEELYIAYPDHRDGKEVATGTYFRIAQLQGNTTFFPALRTLHLNTPDRRQNPLTLSHLPLFLSPTLTSITISHLGEDATGSLACFLIENSPGLLATLVLHSVELSPLLATSISQCWSLEIMDLTFRGLLECSSLQAVLSCPLLSNVRLNTRNIQYGGSQAVNEITADITWNIGGQIHLDGQINMIEDVMTATADRKMLGLTITLIESRDQQIVQHLLRHIAAQQASIMNFTINLRNALVIDASFLSSLVSADTFHEFRTLEFRGLAFQQLDQHLPQMLSHWQHIQHLSFGAPAGVTIARYISLASLKLVAQLCPNLSSLEAPFDSPGDTFDAPGGISDCFLSRKLLKLSLVAFDTSPYHYNNQPISPKIAQQVAHYIYALFPDLDDIKTHPSQKYRDDYWRLVAESYKLFQNFCRREFKELNDMRQRQLDGAGE